MNFNNTIRILIGVLLLVFINQYGNAQCPPGPVNFQNQAQIESFILEYPNCEHLNDRLEIIGDDIVDISGLSKIKSTSGNFIIRENKLDTISFPNLEFVEGIFWIIECDLKSLNLLAFDSLFHFQVADCDSLINLELPNLRHSHWLNIYRNDNLKNISFPSLESCSSFGLGNNMLELKTINISKLNGLEGDLFIDGTGLENLDAFRYFNHIEGNINIRNNPFLNDCGVICTIYESEITPASLSIYDNGAGCNFFSDIYSLCESLPKVSGEVVFNHTNFECFSNDAFRIPFIKFNLFDGNKHRVAYSNQNGQYNYYVQPGNYSLKIEHENSNDVFTEPQNAAINIIEKDTILDFCIFPNQLVSDMCVDFVPVDIARPGFIAEYHLNIKNIGTIAKDGYVDLKYPNELITFDSTELPFQQIDSNLIRIIFPLIEPFETLKVKISFLLNSPLDEPPLNSGDIIKFSMFLLPAQDDINRSNNFTFLEQTVLNSHDPNDKISLIGNQLYIDSLNRPIIYKIRFENLGDASAIHVRIEDVLDSNYYDINTLEIIEASHSMTANLVQQKISFQFRDIMLDFEEPNNDGYVVFKIKPKADLQLGDVIKNEASIYFDFNPAIVTNVSNILITKDDDGDGFFWDEDCDDLNPEAYPGAIEILGNGIDEDCDGKDNTTSTDDVSKSLFKVYPNPASDYIEITNTSKQKMELEIANHLGQTVLRKSIERVENEIELSSLKQGLYFLKIIDRENHTKECIKLVKH